MQRARMMMEMTKKDKKKMMTRKMIMTVTMIMTIMMAMTTMTTMMINLRYQTSCGICPCD
jgi:hypothetical protein